MVRTKNLLTNFPTYQNVECTAISTTDSRRVFLQAFGQGRTFGGPSVLSPRETQVLSLAGAGFAAKEIAILLHVSEQTVNHHRKHAMRKLLARNVAQSVVIAYRNGWLPDV